MSEMVLNVASVRYPIRITCNELVASDGRSVIGLAVFRDGLYIHACVPPRLRRRVLDHEAWHLWVMELHEPTDEEQVADLHAKVAEQTAIDMRAQGGNKALMALPPFDKPALPDLQYTTDAPGSDQWTSPPPSTLHPEPSTLHYEPIDMVEQYHTAAHASGRRAQCGVCLTVVAGDAIVTGPIRFDVRLGGRVVDRAFYCGCCKHVVKWVGGVDCVGTPNDDVCGPPEFLRGDEARAFLAANPQAIAMMV